ncbi:MAG TPA: hypothetical protein ENN65_04930 [Candidatus Hydrogenedentes bacterium]|nr:hypothetical protein [Candidatus Hydrogenedentota bacterium]
MILDEDCSPYLPHQPPLRLIRKIVAQEDDGMVAETVFGDDDFVVGDDGVVEEAAILELIAQSFAAFHGYEHHRDQRPANTGYLVGIKQFNIHRNARAGETLRVRVQRTDIFDHFHAGNGTVYLGDERIADAVITVWIAPDADTDDGA